MRDQRACEATTMLIAILGPYTAFTGLVLWIAENYIRIVRGSVSIIDTRSFEDFRSSFVNRPTNNVIFSCYNPDEIIIAILIKNKIPILTVSDDAVYMVSSTMQLLGCDLLTASRLSTAFYAAVTPIIEGGDFRLVKRNACFNDVVRLVDLVIAKLSLNVNVMDSNAARHQVLSLCSSRAIEALCAERNNCNGISQPTFSQEEVNAIETTFPPIEEVHHLGLRWSPRFLYAESIETHALSSVKIMGRSRTLFFGPHFYLPIGSWRCTFHFNVVDNHSGNTILADILCSEVVLSVGKMVLPPEGSFKFSLDFVVQTSDNVLECRIHTLEGAIGGMLELVDLSFSRI